jgi:hypothetical protein
MLNVSKRLGFDTVQATSLPLMLHLHEAPPFNVILLLLDKGADVNAATQNGERPPH